MEARFLAFLGIAIILTITPGPDFALVTRVVLSGGRRSGLLTSLGVVTGHVVWGLAAGIGVAAIINASAQLYTILRLAGAAYLIWLGARAIFAKHAASEAPAEGAPLRARSFFGAYRQGVINDLLNPKIGVFYTTLLPQFIAPGQPVLLSSVLLATTFALIVALWLGLYVVLLGQANTFFKRPAIQRTLERITGVVLVGLGVRLAIEQR